MARSKGARDADYAEKKAELIGKLGQLLTKHVSGRPSLRQLAQAANVSVATLIHYFGDRETIVAEVLQHYRRVGQKYMSALSVADPDGLEESLRRFLSIFAAVLQTAGIGDILSMGLVEGLFSPSLGPVCASEVLDPALDAMARRLAAHQERGEMRAVDPRLAALIALSPLILASLHQNQLHGAEGSPLDIPTLIEAQVQGFVAAYGCA